LNLCNLQLQCNNLLRLALNKRPQQTIQVVLLAVVELVQIGKFLHCARLSFIPPMGLSSYPEHASPIIESALDQRKNNRLLRSNAALGRSTNRMR
jgi:hypothetical protein